MVSWLRLPFQCPWGHDGSAGSASCGVQRGLPGKFSSNKPNPSPTSQPQLPSLGGGGGSDTLHGWDYVQKLHKCWNLTFLRLHPGFNVTVDNMSQAEPCPTLVGGGGVTQG